MTNRISEKDANESILSNGLKSLRPGLLPDEENGKSSIAKYGAEFPGIGNHSLERMRIIGGLSDWRHFQSQWKLKQNIITEVVTAGMVANALLCDRGRSHKDQIM